MPQDSALCSPDPTSPRVEGNSFAYRARPYLRDPPSGAGLVCPQVPPSSWLYSHEAEDNGTDKAQEQEEGQGAQDGGDNDHAATSPARPRVDYRVRGD